MRNYPGMRGAAFALIALWWAGAVLAEPKNVVLILADDLGRECLGCYGGGSYATPHLNRMAKEGTRFEACYATPMCSPTRVMLMTGQYNFRNYSEWGKMDFSEETMGKVLRVAGYDTAVFGKWHLGGWDAAPYGPERAGFAHHATFDYEKVVREGGEVGNQYWNTEIWEDGKNYRMEGYSPALYQRRALKFIRAHSGSAATKPFFLYYPLVHAHRPFVPDEDAEAAPEEWTARNGDLRHFPAMVKYIDDVVGEVLEALEEGGIAEDSVVIFSSDNGTDNVAEAKELRSRFMGKEVRGGKYLPSELGANVPLIVWGGGVETGRVLDAPVDFTDMLPTLCGMAETGVPEASDGENLWPVLQGGDEAEHDGIALTWGVFERSSKKYKVPRRYRDELVHVVRDRRWKLLSTGELYDLQSDREEVSPSSKGAHREVRKRLGAELGRRRESEPRLW